MKKTIMIFMMLALTIASFSEEKEAVKETKKLKSINLKKEIIRL